MRSFHYFSLFIVISLFLSCAEGPARSDFKGYIPKSTTWEEIFSQPAEIQVTVWNTGQIYIPLSGLINTDDERAAHLKGEKRFVDVPAFLVKTQENGTFLIDTGLDSSMGTNRFERIHGPVKYLVIPEARQMPGQSIMERIKENKVSIDKVFITHLHFDHTAGLTDLESPFSLIVGKGEEAINVPLLFQTDHLKNIDQIQEIDFEGARAIGPFEAVVDLFGDNSVFAISTNGHTDGHVSYLLNTNEGPVIVTGDQINIRENMELMVGPGNYSSDKKAAQEFFEQIMEFKRLYPRTTIFIGHDLGK